MNYPPNNKYRSEDAATIRIITLVREKLRQEFCESKRDEVTAKLMGLYAIMSPAIYELLSTCDRTTVCDHFDCVMTAPIVLYLRHDDPPIDYTKLCEYIGETWPMFKVGVRAPVGAVALAAAIDARIEYDEAECAKISRPLYNTWCHRREGVVDMDVEWKANFSAFREWAVANGYQPGYSMQRKDEEKGFTPENTYFIERPVPNKQEHPSDRDR